MGPESWVLRRRLRCGEDRAATRLDGRPVRSPSEARIGILRPRATSPPWHWTPQAPQLSLVPRDRLASDGAIAVAVSPTRIADERARHTSAAAQKVVTLGTRDISHSAATTVAWIAGEDDLAASLRRCHRSRRNLGRKADLALPLMQTRRAVGGTQTRSQPPQWLGSRRCSFRRVRARSSGIAIGTSSGAVILADATGAGRRRCSTNPDVGTIATVIGSLRQSSTPSLESLLQSPKPGVQADE